MADPTEPNPKVAHGDRQNVVYEADADPDIVAKVRHVFPPSGAEPNSMEHSRGSQDGPPAMPTPEAQAEQDAPSAWEARKPGVDPSDRGD